MATLVGTQRKLVDSVKSLIELDYDSIEAYQMAIDNLENQQYKNQLKKFCNDHRKHVDKLSLLLEEKGIKINLGPDTKQWLTKGKVAMVHLLGDRAILDSMLSNEEDTNSAYHNMNNRGDLWDDLKPLIENGLEDEKRHKKWIEETLRS